MWHKFVVVWILAFSASRGLEAKRRLIICSIDGFAAGYLKHEHITQSPVWSKLLGEARVFSQVTTTLPSVTYPAHTSMMTGRDPAQHGITSNHPIDPFDSSRRGWSWYAEDIRGKTLWEVAQRAGLVVANVEWPVTVGGLASAKIAYNIPQYDRGSGPEETKLMRALSTPGLHREVEAATGISVTELSTDSERFRVAKHIWQKKRPDLMLLYNPGLDTIEHTSGAYSAQAFAQLDILGREISSLRSLLKGPDDGLLVVSDHGFTSIKGRCFPNAILRDMRLIDPALRTWLYYFETSGGVARLAKADAAGEFPLKEFKTSIELTCPDIQVITAENGHFNRFRREYDAKASVFLWASGRVSMTNTMPEKAFDPNLAGYSHGFLPEDAEMQTSALFFSNKRVKTRPISHVKDVYAFSTHWLRLVKRQ